MHATAWIAASLVLPALILGCRSDAIPETQAPGPAGGNQPEAVSLLGKPLYADDLPVANRADLEKKLEAARTAYEADPTSVEGIIWFGRRTAYLGRYREAIRIYSEGIDRHPESYKLLRHRGHRHITLRQFAAAVRDLSRAAELIRGIPDEVEPDGQPNRWNIPTSTSHTNIHYHLGLAYCLLGEFAEARAAYAECLNYCKNDDMTCATVHWLYMTLRRMGMEQEATQALARIPRDMKILENVHYEKLLLMYKGRLDPEEVLSREEGGALDQATLGYGVGNWYLYHGDRNRARRLFERVVAGKHWAAFGFIAAEADLKRTGRGPCHFVIETETVLEIDRTPDGAAGFKTTNAV